MFHRGRRSDRPGWGRGHLVAVSDYRARLSRVGNRWIHTACRVTRIGAKRPRIRRVPRGSTVPPNCRRAGYRGSGSRRSGGTVTVTPNSAATYVASSSLVGRHPS